MQDLSWAIGEATRSTYVLCCPTQLLEEPLMATRRYNVPIPDTRRPRPSRNCISSWPRPPGEGGWGKELPILYAQPLRL